MPSLREFRERFDASRASEREEEQRKTGEAKNGETVTLPEGRWLGINCVTSVGAQFPSSASELVAQGFSATAYWPPPHRLTFSEGRVDLKPASEVRINPTCGRCGKEVPEGRDCDCYELMRPTYTPREKKPCARCGLPVLVGEPCGCRGVFYRDAAERLTTALGDLGVIVTHVNVTRESTYAGSSVQLKVNVEYVVVDDPFEVSPAGKTRASYFFEAMKTMGYPGAHR